jgi:phosphopentomutase
MTDGHAAAARRVFILVLDSVGCGALPDAARYGDEGADTLGHVAAAVGGLSLPALEGLGLGCIHPIQGVAAVTGPAAVWGKMAEASAGKDTTTGHWELAGLVLEEPFSLYPEGFPASLLSRFSGQVGRGVLGNRAASGTAIIEELGPEHLASGDLIVYTSADSVFQIAAHEGVVPLDELYAACSAARRLCDDYRIARVIARPFVGDPGSFTRTYNRKDYSMEPPAPTMLDVLVEAGIEVTGVGKIHDIFAGRGVTRSVHTSGNDDGMDRTIELARDAGPGLVFVNLIDFDMLYGHRNDARGYAAALARVDARLPALVMALRPGDVVFIVADHGCDPTFPGTDHTREHVPLLALGPGIAGGPAGTRRSFADLAETVLRLFGLPAMEAGIPIEEVLGGAGRQ